MTWIRSISSMCTVLALACGGDDDGDGSETQGETTAPTTSATMTGASTTQSEGSGSEGSSSATTTTSATTTVGESSEGTSADTSSGGGSDSGGLTCGDVACATDELCVLPCCGGPAPPCIDMPQGGCNPEDTEVPADQCNTPCATPTCCVDNCVPDPPYCAKKADLMCQGGTNCSIDSCFGMVQDGQLLCECA